MVVAEEPLPLRAHHSIFNTMNFPNLRTTAYPSLDVTDANKLCLVSNACQAFLKMPENSSGNLGG